MNMHIFNLPMMITEEVTILSFYDFVIKLIILRA